MFGKAVAVLLVSIIAWAGFVRPSEATSGDPTYVVQPGDTLWGIATVHYAGDPREAVWRVREANALPTVTLRPGQRLTLP